MIPRKLALPNNESFFLLGPRQTGKSTLIDYSFQANTWKINLLFTGVYLKYSKAPDIFRAEAIEKITNEGIRTIVIDEVQRVPDLLNEVHYLIENYSCQFVLSGSSARKLKRGQANLLAGRALKRYLFPLIYSEVEKIANLDALLRFGSLPPTFSRNQEQNIDLLNSYTEVYLKEEIQQEGLTRNLGNFSRFLDVVASQFGELTSMSALSRDCHLSEKTVQGYYSILEDTLIGFRLEPWRTSLRKRLVAHPKFYLFDNGVTNSINQQLSNPPNPALKGRLFEQFIVLETHRILDYKPSSEINMFFWRTNNGAEVDLIFERHKSLIGAFEIKSGSEISGADLSGIRSFQEDHPETPCFVIANIDEPYKLGSVMLLPWRTYLARLETDTLFS